MSRIMLRGVVCLTACAALTAGAMSAITPLTAASAAPARLAPVLGSAGNGGAIIVWLNDQHSNLNLRTQATQRIADAHADQKPLLADITAHGGTDILQLVSVNAVAATVSKAEVRRLRRFAAVKEIIPDPTLKVGDPETTGPATTKPMTLDQTDADRARSKASADETTTPNPFTNCGTQANPLVEPEALSLINAPAMTNAGLSTEPGDGVLVANDGIDSSLGDLVGNQNFVRPAADGGGSIVYGAAAGDTTNNTDSEYFGDASSVAAQGTVEYQYSTELPYSNLPSTCYFKIVGDAPGATLIDTEDITTPESQSGDSQPDSVTEAQQIAGIDNAVAKTQTDVINESYGYTNTPGSYAIHYTANDTAVAAGVTVVVSSGDSGDSGTVSSPATDPQVIAVGATNSLRESAMAYGFTDWVNNDITPLSSGGTSPNNKLVDLVAPGYLGESACNPTATESGCPTNTQTQAFGGTSESAPLVAGAAADVIAAYRNSHGGAQPTPAQVKQVLTGTATDIDAPADEQGAGLLNIQAAMAAADQLPETTVGQGASNLIPSPTQLDVIASGGTTSAQSVSLFNPNDVATNVSGTYRALGPETQIGSTVTEQVSNPNPDPVPVDGVPAASDIQFQVPTGLDRLDADMTWPDPTNDSILSFTLLDPEGRLRQISYDYGTAATQAGHLGTVPDIQHVEVADPESGPWTAEIKWANGRGHLQSPANTPGTYTGNLSFTVSGQHWITSPATSSPITIPAHASTSIPLSVAMPNSPGDHPESVQFTATDGAKTSVPVARRTVIPSYGGQFATTITSSVGRILGQFSTFDITVPAGEPNLGLTFQTPDTSTDDPISVFIVNPSGSLIVHNNNLRNWPLATTTINGTQVSYVAINLANPAAGTYEIDVKLNLTTSGLEDRQIVSGDVLPQAPVISDPADGSTADTLTPTVDGTGAPGDTVTVVDGDSNPVCDTVVQNDTTWSCTAATQPSGPVTFTATQADGSLQPSPVSNSVGVTIPTTTSVGLGINPPAPTPAEDVTLTATTVGVPDGTQVTFDDGDNVLGHADVTSNIATLDLPGGFGVGDHALTAAAAATVGTLSSESPEVDFTVSKNGSTITLQLDENSAVYGTAVGGSISVSGVANDNATVTYDSTPIVVPFDGSGHGTFTLPSTLAPGMHTITASYAGNDTTDSSTSTSSILTITKVPSTTGIALTANPVQYGHAAHGTVTVTGASSGSATVKVGSTSIPVTFASGHGSFTLPTMLAVGAHSVSATYTGTSTIAPSSATPVKLTVAKAKTKTTASVKKQKVKAGKSDSVSVHVSGHSGAAYPTGTIMVVATIGSKKTTKSVTLTAKDQGTVTVTFALPHKVGTAGVVVHYSGSSKFGSSAAAAQHVTTT